MDEELSKYLMTPLLLPSTPPSPLSLSYFLLAESCRNSQL